MATLWLALFAYAGRPLLAGAAAAGLAPAAAWLLLFAAALLPLLPLVLKRSAAHWIGYAVLGVFSTLLALVFIGDIVRVAYLLLFQTSLNARALSLGILGTAGVLSFVGFVQARWPRTRRVEVAIENLPPELDGYRIVQWSDVHIGPTIQKRFVQRLVEKTNALKADAIAITGDLVDGPLETYREHIAPMADLSARDGVFYVTGNHEYYWRASEWIPALQSVGLDFLKNEHRVIVRGGAKLVIAGVTDPVGRYTHTQDVPRALSSAPREAVKVLLSHRPQTAEKAETLGVDLQLSGHTHGGQFFPWSLFIKHFQPIVAGLHRVGRAWLYVNRGTGYWGPPSRLMVGGEVTVLTLSRAV